MPSFWMDNRPLQTLLTTLQYAQTRGGVGPWEEKGKTIPSQLVRMNPRQLWEHEGEKAVITYQILLPWIIMFLLQPAELNLLSLQGSRTKCSLSNPWEWPFLSTTSERANSTFPLLTKWTFLLWPCLINHRWYKHMENKHRKLSKNINKPGAVIRPLTMRLSS